MKLATALIAIVAATILPACGNNNEDSQIQSRVCIEWRPKRVCSQKQVCKLVCQTLGGTPGATPICEQICELVPECIDTQECVAWTTP